MARPSKCLSKLTHHSKVPKILLLRNMYNLTKSCVKYKNNYMETTVTMGERMLLSG